MFPSKASEFVNALLQFFDFSLELGCVFVGFNRVCVDERRRGWRLAFREGAVLVIDSEPRMKTHDGCIRFSPRWKAIDIEHSSRIVRQHLDQIIDGPTQVDESGRVCSGYKGQELPRNSRSRGGSSRSGRSRWRGRHGDPMNVQMVFQSLRYLLCRVSVVAVTVLLTVSRLVMCSFVGLYSCMSASSPRSSLGVFALTADKMKFRLCGQCTRLPTQLVPQSL